MVLDIDNNSYNRYPDEKGTERTMSTLFAFCLESVTTVTPMKRGLKVDNHLNAVCAVYALQPLPR